jgi:hypothetical protein
VLDLIKCDIISKRKGVHMSKSLNINFINYFDFLGIAVEAYKKSHKYISKKILSTLDRQLHNNNIELEKLLLELQENAKDIDAYDLDSVYDTMLDAIEDVKLLKFKIKKLTTNEFEFTNLYNEADEAHDKMLEIIERLTSLEIEELKKQKAA